MIVLTGLGMIVLGGCFVMGIVAVATEGAAFGFNHAGTGPPTIGPAARTALVVLYLLAFGCFAGAVAVIRVGLRGLLRVMRD